MKAKQTLKHLDIESVDKTNEINTHDSQKPISNS